MSEEVYIAFAVLLVAAALVEGWKRFRAPRTRLLRAFGRLPTIRFADCRDGALSRIAGRAEVDATRRTAPVSNTPCIGYHVAFIRVGVRDASEPTALLCEQTAMDEFVLRGESDSARVAPEDATAILLGPIRRVRSTYRDLPERARDVMKDFGFDAADVGGAGALIECHELVLLPGDSVIVAGIARWEVDASAVSVAVGAAFRDASRSVRMRATGDNTIVVARVAGAPGSDGAA